MPPSLLFRPFACIEDSNRDQIESQLVFHPRLELLDQLTNRCLGEVVGMTYIRVFNYYYERTNNSRTFNSIQLEILNIIIIFEKSNN